LGQEVKTTEEIFGGVKTTEEIFGGMKTTEELFSTAPLRAETPDPATIARMEATQEGVRGPMTNLPPGQKFARDLGGLTNRVAGGVYNWASSLMGTLSKAADYITTLNLDYPDLQIPGQKGTKKTKPTKGAVLKYLHERWKNDAERANKIGIQGVVGDFMESMGSAAGTIGEIGLLGPMGMPIHGAIKGGLEGVQWGSEPDQRVKPGLGGTIYGAVQGGLIHGSLKGMSQLPIVPKLLSAFGFGTATSPGDLKQKLESGATWTGLMALGGKSKSMREFIDNYPKIRDGITASKIAIATKGAVKPKEIMEAGGPQVVMDELVKEFQKTKPVEQRVAKPKIAGKEVKATGMEIPAPPEGRVPSGKMVYGAELPKMAGSINLERVGGDYNVKSLIRDTADIYSEAITKARRGEVTMVESAAAADALGMNVQTLVKNVKGRTENLDAHILALRDTLATSATHVIKAAKEYMADPIDNNLFKMNHYRDIHAAIQLEASRGATEIGRALNIHKKISRSKEILLTQSYEKALGVLSGRKKKISKRIAELMAHTDFENPLQAAKFLREVQDVKTTDKVFELWMNSILSGAHTHVVNSVSNVGMAVDKMAMTTVAAALEAPKALFGKKREVLFGEAPYQYAGGTGKGKIAEKVLESAKRQGFEIESGLEVGIRNAAFAWSNELSARDIQASKLDVIRPAAIKGAKGKVIRVPTRALITLDELAKGVIHQMDIWGLAYRKASHEGLKGQAKTDRIAELISRPTETMKAHAVEEMTVRTFQKELGSIGDKVMRIRNMVPGLRYLIPFVKVSINLPKEALRRSPLNIARVTYKYRAGEMKGAELAEQAALGFMGMMTAASIFKFALDGKITGDYPTDKNERDEWKRTGKQPYSMVYKVGGEKKYLSFERLEPLGTVLSLSADAANIYKSVKEGKEFDDVAEQLVNVAIENLFDKTFMRGFYTFAKALVDPEQNLDYFVKSFTSSAIPRAVSQTARAIDPVMRDARSLIDFYKTQIPFLSKEVPAKKDIWGRDEKTGGSAVFRLMSPFYYNEDMSTRVDKELSELGITIGKPGKTGILPRTEPKREAYKMTSTEYEKMSEESGKSIYVALSNLISSKLYSSLPPMERIKMIESVVSSMRGMSGIPYKFQYSQKKGQE